MKAAGPWAWWNQYGSVPLSKCLERAKDVRGVIVKAGWWHEFDEFRAVGPVAIERYVYPDNVPNEIVMLCAGLDRGAEFAVINAEAEWEGFTTEEPMMQLVNGIRARNPGAELYASIDSRGNRTRTPCLRALIRECTGVMPEVYPKAFRPSMPPGAVPAAFVDSIAAKDFQGKPLLPTLQTYDGIGAIAVTEQIAQCERPGYQGWQAYTIAHATDAEWAAFIANIPKEDDMADEATKRRWAAAAAIFSQIHDYANIGLPAPIELVRAARFLIKDYPA